MLCCTAGLSHFHWTFDFPCPRRYLRLHTNRTGAGRISSFLPPRNLKSMNFGPWGTFADESYAPQAERARNVVVGAVGPDSSRLLNFLLADYSGVNQSRSTLR